jgi:hypothetical protein
MNSMVWECHSLIKDCHDKRKLGHDVIGLHPGGDLEVLSGDRLPPLSIRLSDLSLFRALKILSQRRHAS